MNILTNDTVKKLVSVEWLMFQKFFVLSGASIIVMWRDVSLLDQSLYSSVTNLGSLVVRLLIQPIEEIGQTTFIKLKSQKNSKALLLSFVQYLRKLHMIGLCIVVFGPSYASILLQIYYGDKYQQTEASDLLGLYCYYIHFLSLNGLIEVFMNMTLELEELDTVEKRRFYLTLLFLLISYNFTHTLSGLILSSLFTTFSVMILNLSHLNKKEKIHFKGVFLQPGLYLSFFLSFLLTRYSVNWSPLLHLSIGGISLFIILIQVYMRDI
jgi:oligosaccharide translocation protein RFT1